MKKRKYIKIQVLEPEIVSMQAAGKTHKEIAEQLGLEAQSGQKMFGETPYPAAKAGFRDTDEAQGPSPQDGQPPHQSKAAELKRLRMENQLLQNFLELAGRGVRTRVKYHVIDLHRNAYPVTVMCQFFGVSRSGYYDFVHRLGQPEPDAELGQQVQKYENMLSREFHADKPNTKWVTDISWNLYS